MSPATEEPKAHVPDPYQPPRADLGAASPRDAIIAWPRGRKRWPWLMLLAISTVVPFLEVAVSRRPLGSYGSVTLVDTLLFIIALYWWYVVDRQERDFRAGGWQNMGIIFFAVVGLPVYLFRSRGFLRGLVATIVAFSVFIVVNVLSYFSEVLALRAVIS